MKALEKLRMIKKTLDRTGIDGSVRDAELILTHSLGNDRASLYRDNPEISDDILEVIDTLTERRSRREPMQYILGYTDFCGLRIAVGPGVLIPRPETELLAVHAMETVRDSMRRGSSADLPAGCPVAGSSTPVILDLCTGSGCLAIALAKEFPSATVYGTDTSADALKYAGKNAELNGVSNALFLRGDLFDPLAERRFDLIVSNPPYIQTEDLRSLQPEIRDWEPGEALDGGGDGLDYYRRIISEGRGHLKECATLMLEVGLGQSDAVVSLLEKSGFTNISVTKDYAGIERIVKAGKG